MLVYECAVHHIFGISFLSFFHKNQGFHGVMSLMSKNGRVFINWCFFYRTARLPAFYVGNPSISCKPQWNFEGPNEFFWWNFSSWPVIFSPKFLGWHRYYHNGWHGNLGLVQIRSLALASGTESTKLEKVWPAICEGKKGMAFLFFWLGVGGRLGIRAYIFLENKPNIQLEERNMDEIYFPLIGVISSVRPFIRPFIGLIPRL